MIKDKKSTCPLWGDYISEIGILLLNNIDKHDILHNDGHGLVQLGFKSKVVEKTMSNSTQNPAGSRNV